MSKRTGWILACVLVSVSGARTAPWVGGPDFDASDAITATASTWETMAGSGDLLYRNHPVRTIDGSGLDATGQYHSSEGYTLLPGVHWLGEILDQGNKSGATDTGAGWIQYEFDDVYELGPLQIWNHNNFTTRGMRGVVIDYSVDGADWLRLGDFEIPEATGESDYAGSVVANFGGASAKYVTITAKADAPHWGANNIGLSEVRFHLAQENRGWQWVRTHPTYLSGLLQIPDIFNVNRFRNSGLNTLLPWKLRDGVYFREAAEGGMSWHFHIHSEGQYGQTPEEVVAAMRQYVEEYPGCTGFQYGDEPQHLRMAEVAPYLAALREAFPDKVVYSNALPQGAASMDKYYGGPAPPGYGYDDYLDAFARTLNTDVLMFDIYPFDNGGDTATLYFENLGKVRTAAQRYDLPYWMYVQSFGPAIGRRLPSESDLRMQLYSGLAYGFTGFAYFTYDIAFVQGLIKWDGLPSPLYAGAAGANPEVENLGHTMRFMRSTDVRFIPGGSGGAPRGLDNWRPGDGGDPHIVAISTEGIGESEDGLIGFFTDDEQNRFFLLVNLSHGPDLSAAETALAFRIEFDATITALMRFDRETRRQELVLLDDHVLEITLPGGTGDLYGYGEFPVPTLGDANLDGAVDDDDLSLLLANWTGPGGTGKTWATGDFDNNGAVSDADLSFLLANWTDPGETVPEPSTAAFFIAASLASGLAHRRRR